MAGPAQHPTPDELAAHAAAARAFAARLVVDAHLADDVAQEAVARGLRGGGGSVARPLPWLRGIVRNVARHAVRSASRRAAHESRAVPRAAPETPADIAARAELIHRAVAELLALDEPYRATLLLHFFDGLAPAEIAARDDVPAGTVRSRLKRGLDMLRARLDAAHGDDRRAWAVPLALACRRPAPPPAAAPLAPLLPGVLAMSAKAVTAAVVVVVAAAGGVAWLALRDAPAPAADPAAAPAAPTTVGDDTAAAEPSTRVRGTDDGPAPLPEPPPAVHADVWVVGRVLGDGRFPVGGALVSIAPAWHDARTTTTDADGRFRLPCDAPPDGVLAAATVHAHTADGRAALASVALAPPYDGDRDARTLVLGPAADLDVVVADAAGPVEGALVAVGMTWRVAAATTDAAGRVRFERLPCTELRVTAAHPERGRAAAQVTPAAAPEPVALELTRRDIEVLVVRAGDGAPVPGRTVHLNERFRTAYGFALVAADPPFDIAPTDADGRTWIRAAGAAQALSISVDGGPSASARREVAARVDASQTSVRLELPALRTFAWRLVPGDVPVPEEGTVLEMLPWTNSGAGVPCERATVHQARIVLPDVEAERVACYARTPDGRIALLRSGADGTEPEVTFRRERTIEVHVAQLDGRPVAGAWVVAKDQGNNPVCAPVTTDADGVARIEHLWGWLVAVSVIPSRDAVWAGDAVGSVDLEQGGARLEYVVRPLRRVRVRTRLDGRPALPSNYALRTRTGAGLAVVAEDPAAGTLEATLPDPGDDAELVLRLDAPPYVPADATVDADGVAAFDLVRGATVRGRVVMPADGRSDAGIQRWDAENARWVRVGGRGPGQGPAPDGTLREAGLSAGRYRMTDSRCGLATRPVDVAQGEEAELGVLDLSHVGWVRGRVTAPDGADLSLAWVRVTARDVDAPEASGLERARVSANGAFQVRVAGDRPTRLEVVHPVLRASADGGACEVGEPREGVELRLERGPVVQLTTVVAIRSPFGRPPRLVAWRGEPRGTPDFQSECVLAGEGISVAAPPPGRWTLWIDTLEYAPLLLRDVAVGEDGADLGRIALSRGSSIRVRARVAEGTSAPRLSIWAWHGEEPAYVRGLNSDGATEVLLSGLGAGTFTLTIGAIVGGPSDARLRREITVDGAEGTVVDIDWR